MSEQRDKTTRQELIKIDAEDYPPDPETPLVIDKNELSVQSNKETTNNQDYFSVAIEPTLTLNPGEIPERPKADFVISETEVPQLSKIVISEADVPVIPKLSITEIDLMKETLILLPRNGQNINKDKIDVSGTSQPNARLVLTVHNHIHQADADGETGKFTFRDVPLIEGENTISVKMVGYETYPKCTSLVNVVYEKPQCPYANRKDPYTQGVLKPEDDVVRCKRCGNYQLRVSWETYGRCTMDCGNKKNYYTKDNPEFYEVEEE